MNYSDNGLAVTQQCEGLRLQAYQDSAGIWTIGNGHTGKDVGPGMSITPDQAKVLLRSDIAASETCVNHAVAVPLTQGQFDALVDFTFNVGRAAFLGSTLLQCVNQNRLDLAPAEFGRWVFAAGKVIQGLLARREAEIKLWSSQS